MNELQSPQILLELKCGRGNEARSASWNDSVDTKVQHASPKPGEPSTTSQQANKKTTNAKNQNAEHTWPTVAADSLDGPPVVLSWPGPEALRPWLEALYRPGLTFDQAQALA